MASSGKTRRRREARLQRQADVEVEDDFEKFRAQATGRYRRLSASKPVYGGSLPSFRVEESFTDSTDKNEEMKDQEPEVTGPETMGVYYNGPSGHLSVPLSPMIYKRSHSAGNEIAFDLPPARNPSTLSPVRFFTSVKTLLDECGEKQGRLKSQSSTNTSLDVPGVNKCPSAPHSRSNSFKRKKVKDMMQQEEKHMQERTASMPTICKTAQGRPSNLPLSAMRLHPNSCDSTEEWERVRNFMTSPKGIINCGDSFRRSNSSLRSVDSWGSEEILSGWGRSNSRGDTRPVPLHRVLILGGPGVGKTTLAQQFITSDCLVNVEVIGEGEDCMTVSVLLDDEEAKVDILEIPFNQDYRHICDVDAYIVMYGTNDRGSFHHAVDLLYTLCKEEFVQNPVILVANKTDLVRAREVAEQEGKSAAVTYTCKYFEVSSLMNLKVDELLAGILNQIRLRKSNTSNQSEAPVCTQDCGVKSPMMLIGRMFRPAMLKRQQSKSCDNLLVL